jgi:hypothetical protein
MTYISFAFINVSNTVISKSLNVTESVSLNESILKCAIKKHYRILKVYKTIVFKYEYWYYKYTNKIHEIWLYFLTFKSVSFTKENPAKSATMPERRSNENN